MTDRKPLPMRRPTPHASPTCSEGPYHGAEIELPDHLFTVEETAKLINASSKTIYRRIRTGELPAYRDGRILRIHPNDLARYIAARRSR